MRLWGWRRGVTSFRAGRAAALAAMVLSLGACASLTSTPVVLLSIPRRVQFAPLDEWVYLWDRPGGPSARAVRVAKVPSGTAGLVVESEPSRPLASGLWDAIGAENNTRQPVDWVKVATPRGEGWVRREFVEPR
ncbi:MAG: hypothetical protein HYU38_07925 [Candidatus Tectomicrobia bacterium]|nr:hypothetical protein [Candidatus Tectomicrobia bacterium]